MTSFLLSKNSNHDLPRSLGQVLMYRKKGHRKKGHREKGHREKRTQNKRGTGKKDTEKKDTGKREHTVVVFSEREKRDRIFFINFNLWVCHYFTESR